MFNSRIVLFLTVSVFSFMAFSCEEDDDYKCTPTSAEWFADTDTVLNAKEHSFIVEFKDCGEGLPENWTMGGISLDEFHNPEGGDWLLIPNDINTDDMAAVDWITAERADDEDGLKMKITVKANAGVKRAARIGVIQKQAYNSWVECEYFVTQEADYDHSPFDVKIRYKGKLYTTSAHIDDEGNSIYENEEFNKILNIIESKDNIETVVMGEEGIVDYFDDEDLSANPSLKRCCLRQPNLRQ